jgi:enoyl-[acyl-carrier protein] reductase I
MYNLLKGKRGIIFGALDENSIAWKTAEKGMKAVFCVLSAPASIRDN